MRKKTCAILGTAALALSTFVVTAPPAHAVSKYGCGYPAVCLYQGSYSSGYIIWHYSSYGYTNMPTSTRNIADAVVNTRNDDSVWVMDTGHSPDAYLCVPANTAFNLGDFAHPNGTTWANDVDTIVIWNDSGGCARRQGTVPDGWRP